MKATDPAHTLFEAAQRVVDDHGWAEATQALERALRSVRNGLPHDESALTPIFDVVKTLPQSAWTPILAPLAAAGLTTINQPTIDKAGAA